MKKLSNSINKDLNQDIKLFHSEDVTCCELCKKNYFNYTCPVCKFSLCSLQCYKNHKKNGKCNDIGLEYKEKIELEKIDEFLLTDLKYLNKVGEEVEIATRLNSRLLLDKMYCNVKQSMLPPFNFTKAELNSKLIKKIKTSRIFYIKAPTCSFIHKRNTTKLSRTAAKTIKWHIEIKYCNQTYSIPSVNEHIKLKDLCELMLKNVLLENWENNHLLLFKDESLPSNKRCWFSFDFNMKLSNALIGLIVVEFPIFYLIEKKLLESSDKTNIVFDDTRIPEQYKIIIHLREKFIGMYNNMPIMTKLQITEKEFDQLQSKYTKVTKSNDSDTEISVIEIQDDTNEINQISNKYLKLNNGQQLSTNLKNTSFFPSIIIPPPPFASTTNTRQIINQNNIHSSNYSNNNIMKYVVPPPPPPI